MRNSFWVGLLIGLVFPLIAFLLTKYTDLSTRIFGGKEIGFYAVAVLVNMLLVRQFYRPSLLKDNMAKGVVMITFLALILFLYTHKIRV